MKHTLHPLTGAVVAAILSLSAWAQNDPSPTPLGAELPFREYINIEVQNFQGERLGRIVDLGIDLANGRVVEVLVACDHALTGGKKIVAVPPLALFPDSRNEIYRLNVSPDVFKSAPAIDLKTWTASGRSDRVAAAYRLFGQEPYFLEAGDPASPTDERPKVALGYVERGNRILDLPVGNFQNEKFGTVWSFAVDIPNGRILDVIVLAPGNFKTKSMVPAMALSFNARRDALLLDDTMAEYADQPRYVYTAAALGQDAYYHRESYQGPHTAVALEQGGSYRDVDRTDRINREIRAARIDGRNVEVGTINERVTLRGWVYTNEDKRRIGEIAIAASRLELVDNQIVAGKPLTAN